MIYNTTNSKFNYWDGSQWQVFPAVSGNDSDWFLQGTTTAPTSISDNIYRSGRMGIGISTPVEQMHLYNGKMRFQNSTGIQYYNLAMDSDGFSIGYYTNAETFLVNGYNVHIAKDVGLGPGHVPLTIGQAGDGTTANANAWATYSDRRYN